MSGDSLNILLGVITAVTAVASVVLAIKSYQLDKRNDASEQEITKLSETLKRFKEEIGTYTWSAEPFVTDVFFLGPRQSGKSSIVQLWKKPWTNIHTLSGTDKWDEHKILIDEVKKIERKSHPKFEVECDFRTNLQLRVRDYSGEDRFRISAMEDLGKTNNKAVVVFVMKVGYSNGRFIDADISKNSEYFSAAFVEIVRNSLSHIAGSIVKVVVVFNKIDLLPSTWSSEQILAEMKSANSESVHTIERIFSPLVEYKLTSAQTNYGLIDLLGTVVSALVGKDIDKATLNGIAARLKKP